MEPEDSNANDINSLDEANFLSLNSSASYESSLLSPTNKSRYGRTRKPKVSEDYCDIDEIFNNPHIIKSTPIQKPKRSAPLKKLPSKIVTAPRSPSPDFHVTGDNVEDVKKPVSSNSVINSPTRRKFFKREPKNVNAVETSPSLKLGEKSSNITDLNVQNAKETKTLDANLEEDNFKSDDVEKVLKIISVKPSDVAQDNCETKSSLKPVVKTYGNKRKSALKAPIESFGLPDVPLFPLEKEKAKRTPKRIENLDVPSTSESKQLLEMPWQSGIDFGDDLHPVESHLFSSDLELPVVAKSSPKLQNGSKFKITSIKKAVTPTKKKANGVAFSTKAKKTTGSSSKIISKTTTEVKDQASTSKSVVKEWKVVDLSHSSERSIQNIVEPKCDTTPIVSKEPIYETSQLIKPQEQKEIEKCKDSWKVVDLSSSSSEKKNTLVASTPIDLKEDAEKSLPGVEEKQKSKAHSKASLTSTPIDLKQHAEKTLSLRKDKQASSKRKASIASAPIDLKEHAERTLALRKEKLISAKPKVSSPSKGTIVMKTSTPVDLKEDAEETLSPRKEKQILSKPKVSSLNKETTAVKTSTPLDLDKVTEENIPSGKEKLVNLDKAAEENIPSRKEKRNLTKALKTSTPIDLHKDAEETISPRKVKRNVSTSKVLFPSKGTKTSRKAKFDISKDKGGHKPVNLDELNASEIKATSTKPQVPIESSIKRPNKKPLDVTKSSRGRKAEKARKKGGETKRELRSQKPSGDTTETSETIDPAISTDTYPEEGGKMAESKEILLNGIKQTEALSTKKQLEDKTSQEPVVDDKTMECSPREAELTNLSAISNLEDEKMVAKKPAKRGRPPKRSEPKPKVEELKELDDLSLILQLEAEAAVKSVEVPSSTPNESSILSTSQGIAEESSLAEDRAENEGLKKKSGANVAEISRKGSRKLRKTSQTKLEDTKGEIRLDENNLSDTSSGGSDLQQLRVKVPVKSRKSLRNVRKTLKTKLENTKEEIRLDENNLSDTSSNGSDLQQLRVKAPAKSRKSLRRVRKTIKKRLEDTKEEFRLDENNLSDTSSGGSDIQQLRGKVAVKSRKSLRKLRKTLNKRLGDTKEESQLLDENNLSDTSSGGSDLQQVRAKAPAKVRKSLKKLRKTPKKRLEGTKEEIRLDENNLSDTSSGGSDLQQIRAKVPAKLRKSLRKLRKTPKKRLEDTKEESQLLDENNLSDISSGGSDIQQLRGKVPVKSRKTLRKLRKTSNKKLEDTKEESQLDENNLRDTSSEGSELRFSVKVPSKSRKPMKKLRKTPTGSLKKTKARLVEYSSSSSSDDPDFEVTSSTKFAAKSKSSRKLCTTSKTIPKKAQLVKIASTDTSLNDPDFRVRSSFKISEKKRKTLRRVRKPSAKKGAILLGEMSPNNSDDLSVILRLEAEASSKNSDVFFAHKDSHKTFKNKQTKMRKRSSLPYKSPNSVITRSPKRTKIITTSPNSITRSPKRSNIINLNNKAKVKEFCKSQAVVHLQRMEFGTNSRYKMHKIHDRKRLVKKNRVSKLKGTLDSVGLSTTPNSRLKQTKMKKPDDEQPVLALEVETESPIRGSRALPILIDKKAINKSLLESEESEVKPEFDLVSEDNKNDEKLECKQVELKEEVSQQEANYKIEGNYEPGNLLWAKLGGYPYWPCIIYTEPKSNTYLKVQKKLMYHIRFFGDNGRRSWVFSKSILPYIEKDDLEKMHRNEDNKIHKEKYVVQPKYLPKWQIAVDEAESLRSKTPQERLDFFFEMFASEREKIKKLKLLQGAKRERDEEEAIGEPLMKKRKGPYKRKLKLSFLDLEAPKIEEEIEKEKETQPIAKKIKVNINIKDQDEKSPKKKVKIMKGATEVKKSPKKEAKTIDDKPLVEKSPKKKVTSTNDPVNLETSPKKQFKSNIVTSIGSKFKQNRLKTLRSNKPSSSLINKNFFKLKMKQKFNSKVKRAKLVQKKVSPSKPAKAIKKDSSLNESSLDLLKASFGDADLHKRHLRSALNDANSDYSFSDSDTLSKSSSNSSVSSKFKFEITRYKKCNIFKGVSRERLCQVCHKSGDVKKCKGPCNGLLHKECSATLLNNIEVKKEVVTFEEVQIVPAEVQEQTLNVLKFEEFELSNMNNIKNWGNCEIIEILSDYECPSDVLIPESQNMSREEFKQLPLSEKIDLKMGELMETIGDKTRCSEDSTEESTLQSNDLEDNLVYGHVTADGVSYGSFSENETESDKNCNDPVIVTKENETAVSEPMEVTAILEPMEVIAISESMEITAVSEPMEVTAVSDKCEVTDVLEKLEATAVSEKSEATAISKKSEATAVSEKSDATTISEKSEATAALEMLDVTAILDKSEVTVVSENLEAITVSEKLPVTAVLEKLETTADASNGDFKCGFCTVEIDPPCFICKKQIPSDADSILQKCSLHMCGKYYHNKCLKSWPQTQWLLSLTAKQKNSEKQRDPFVCPMHVCQTCTADNPRAASSRCSSDKVVRCLHCPATYHSTNYCVPAGSSILSASQIICPRHTTKRNIINTPWCMICSEGGKLICCETCPTSVHEKCLVINLLEDGKFICEECESGRFPLFDEVVWVKMNKCRWWPAVILFPNEVPEKVQKHPHKEGDFVVRFFGSHDHIWASKGRTFLFHEDDKGIDVTNNKTDQLFNIAVMEAREVHQFKKSFRESQMAEIKKSALKPPHYIKVKVNKPVGNVRQFEVNSSIFDGNVSNTTACECNPTLPSPCGPDSYCLNRLLLTECDPNVCPAKEKCNNQRFEKREYPPLMPYETPSRGWGLKTLEPIKMGQFVIEYVGEVIDDQEYQRRINKMHERQDQNYYFLTIDKDRIIDAGPKGNLARFMNHSCQPNCETQKWTVNGDTRVGLFAMDDIEADTELTFNYNLECVGKEKKVCRCGAANCNGFIGVKSKTEESQKKNKKKSIKKKSIILPPTKNDGPCFVCGEMGHVAHCYNKICNKYYHLKCVKLEEWPENKWVCPWHNCNVCAKRTIRCCVKCINSYCPVHSEGNVRYDKLLGFVCCEHDPTKESHAVEDYTKVTKAKSSSLNTEETDVTSTTSDELDSTQTSTCSLNTNTTCSDSLLDAEDELNAKQIDPVDNVNQKVKVSQKRKKNNKNSLSSKKIKLISNDSVVAEQPEKPKPSSSSLIDVSMINEVKLSPSVPSRHLRTTRNNVNSNEVKRFLRHQSEVEKDLPIRKRSRLRCESV